MTRASWTFGHPPLGKARFPFDVPESSYGMDRTVARTSMANRGTFWNIQLSPHWEMRFVFVHTTAMWTEAGERAMPLEDWLAAEREIFKELDGPATDIRIEAPECA